MNLRDLRYLVALADLKHFGRAADRCAVSQPTLSAQLKKLEDYLGVALVERQPRNVCLSPIGEAVVARARRVLQESDDIVEIARSSRDPLAGSLRIALIPTLGPYLLPMLAPKLRKRLPKLQLMLYEHQTATLVQQLKNGEIDLGILALGVDLDGLESRELAHESFTVALPSHHPLAKKTSFKMEDLDDETLLLLEDGHCLRAHALDACSRIRIHEAADFRATSLETLRQMVASGHGITLLPELATRGPFAATKNPVIRPFSKPAPYRIIGAVWRKSSTRLTAIDAVCNIVSEVLGE